MGLVTLFKPRVSKVILGQTTGKLSVIIPIHTHTHTYIFIYEISKKFKCLNSEMDKKS